MEFNYLKAIKLTETESAELGWGRVKSWVLCRNPSMNTLPASDVSERSTGLLSRNLAPCEDSKLWGQGDCSLPGLGCAQLALGSLPDFQVKQPYTLSSPKTDAAAVAFGFWHVKHSVSYLQWVGALGFKPHCCPEL